MLAYASPSNKSDYRSSNIVNCLGAISQLLPSLFHTRYTKCIASLPKTAPSFYYALLYSCKPIQQHLQSTSSFILVLGKANTKHA